MIKMFWTILLVAVQLVLTQCSGESRICLSCTAVGHPRECTSFAEVWPHEQCSTTLLLLANSTPVYNFGYEVAISCILSDDVMESSPIVRTSSTGIPQCHECCTESLCNRRLCGIKESNAAYLACLFGNDVHGGSGDTYIAYCTTDEQCYAESVTATRPHRMQYGNYGCASQVTCDRLMRGISNGGAQAVCQKCCSRDACNAQICHSSNQDPVVASELALNNTYPDTNGTTISAIDTTQTSATNVTQIPTTNVTQIPITDVTQISTTHMTQITTTNVTQIPTTNVTQIPTTNATQIPTTNATQIPTTNATPTTNVIQIPITDVTQIPTTNVTQIPTTNVTQIPTTNVTQIPTTNATQVPTINATQIPITNVAQLPSTDGIPITDVTQIPITDVTQIPTTNVTQIPTANGTQIPTTNGTQIPTTMSSTFSDCWDLQSRGGYHTNGIYDIYPSPSHPHIRVRCDMTTDGGGWTMLQRRFDGSLNFTRTFLEYEEGFGNVVGEHWLGLDAMHILTSRGGVQLRVDLCPMNNGSAGYAVFRGFSVSDRNDTYRLTTGMKVYGNLVGIWLMRHNGRVFQTTGGCAGYYKGGWWYETCMYVNLNGGRYNVGGTQNGIVWWSFGGDERHPAPSLRTSEMKIRPITAPADPTHPYTCHR